MKLIITRGDNELGRRFSRTPSVAGETEYKKLMIVEDLLQLMKEQGISRTELAKRMGVQPSRVTSMLTGSNNFTIATLVRAARAVGAELQQHLVPVTAAISQTAKAKKAEMLRLTRVAEEGKPYRASRRT
ncbi:MAG: helix-turn-helix transcriptional regulator [Verrucomicrobia bacterium]|nr:helix-turn-helix transcriptional regulator [Verrucomicrobiota bacterium]